MKKYDVVSWDSGTSFDKLVIGGNESERIKSPSNVYEVTDKEKLGLNQSKLLLKNLHIKYEGVLYYVGEKAIEQDAKGGQRNFRTQSYKEPSQVAKFLIELAYLSKDKDIEIELLMLDLNMREYKENQGSFASIYKNKTFKFKIGDKEHKVKVRDVKVNPQGIIAAYSNDIDWEGRMVNQTNRRRAIIDVGGRTADGALFKGLGMIDGTHFGTEEGMTDAFKNVGNSLGVPWQLVENAYINDEELYYGGRKEYDELCNKAFKKLSKRIFDDATAQWSKQLLRIGEIDMVGGGGKSTLRFFNNYFNDKEVNLIKNPQFANAIGNYKLGKLLQRNKEKEIENED